MQKTCLHRLSKFGLENEGKVVVIVRVLYGGKAAGADCWRHVRTAMNELGFEPCKADPDVWYRPSTKNDDSRYYQYVLLYTDDILAVMGEPEKFLREECLLIHSILNYFTAGSCLTHLVEELFVNNLVTFGEDVHVRKVDLAHGGY